MSGITVRAVSEQDQSQRATAHIDPPAVVTGIAAFGSNAPRYRGVLCYSLAVALWLHTRGTSDDLLVA